MPQGEFHRESIVASAKDAGAELRILMVNSQIRARGIRNVDVISAMLAIPREMFVNSPMTGQAYEDRALGIDCGQTISQPYIVAFMSEALGVERGHRLLEIGTGSGYQTAILAMLADEVFTVERHAELSRVAQKRIESLGCRNVHYKVGDGTLGWQEHAPFDRILVTASAPSIMTPIIKQLSEGGRLVLPVGDGDRQIITIVEKNNGRLIERPSIPVRFVKLIGEAGFDE